MKPKRIPMRKCSGCGEKKEKNKLIRVVKAPDKKNNVSEMLEKGKISVDFTGKSPGRGAYICKNPNCLKAARKARRFERAFCCKIPDEVYERLEKEMSS